MAEPARSPAWWYRALFVAVAAALLFVQLLPLPTKEGGLPGPDLLLCLTFAWVLRRPEFVPALLIAGVILVQDMLVMRPPGLWAVVVLLSSEFLRGRAALARDLPFVIEWALVGAVMFAAMLIYRTVMAITMVPQTGLGLTVVQLALTFLAYPAVVFLSQTMFRIRRTAPGAMDVSRGRPR